MWLLGLSTAIAYRPPGCSPRLIPSVQNYCAEVIDGTYKRDSTTEGGSEGILRAIRSLNAFMLNLSACIVFAHSLSLSLSLNGVRYDSQSLIVGRKSRRIRRINFIRRLLANPNNY